MQTVPGGEFLQSLAVSLVSVTGTGSLSVCALLGVPCSQSGQYIRETEAATSGSPGHPMSCVSSVAERLHGSIAGPASVVTVVAAFCLSPLPPHPVEPNVATARIAEPTAARRVK